MFLSLPVHAAYPGCMVPADPCTLPNGSIGYCGEVNSNDCNPCKPSGSRTAFGRDYECCSGYCPSLNFSECECRGPDIKTKNTQTQGGGMPQIKNPFDSLQIKIPGLNKFSEARECAGEDDKLCVPWIAEYIAGVYKYAIGIIGILATVVMMIGGVIWITAGGNASSIGEAKAWIGASLTGLVIALSSYMILYQINPKLVAWGPLKISKVVPLVEEQEKFASQGCPSEAERTGGFAAFTTAYCRPTTSTNYGDTSQARKDFLCKVGLNCSCPAGRSPTNDCQNSQGFGWKSCSDFDDKNLAYCNQTASGGEPSSGQVAADWSCFSKNSSVCINGTTYAVTDKGSAIKGRRFDIWVNDCSQAGNYTGTVNVKAGTCE